ncbi:MULTISPECIES: YedE family putative selenium transporter [Mogibacterium]|uniref:Selenium metabolism protein, YedE family n=2 Tax=Mogibacterium timidum TaxID=35519 RepID=X8IRT9_9FIRM|nr:MULTISPECIES: YedE family putative selenium transporter [Mogibacterium]EJU23276.1 selenium metabolism protein, YedE family [Mogibacterium sp. CM50]EUC52362.1 selenium metabolism protein, YedE family [Mogibacterium timidum ATCC 33093]NWO22761.1 YedE-related selenium metabolism membrane protein [Mogibacterium timidum]
MKKEKSTLIIITGLIVGAAAILLVKYGNPANMGFCIACFLRDTAGALKLHSAPVVQYARPEIIGLILGAFAMSLGSKEFKVRGGSSPMTRFVLSFFVMVGALMFLGCPLRMILRIAGGDWNAIIGLIGFVVGIVGGILFLRKGFTLKKSVPLGIAEGAAMPAITVVLLVILCAFPALLVFSKLGPGAMRAPLAISLVAGLVVGVLAQRTRLCMVGGFRDAILFKDFYLLSGFIAIFVAAIVGNLILGNFHAGFDKQPIAFNDALWNFLGMVLVGLGSCLLGGCPLRQVVLSGTGNADSGVAVLGMIVGAAFCHNFALASSPLGPTPNGKIAVIFGIIVTVIIGLMNVRKVKEA